MVREKVYPEGFRLVVDDDGLLIEPLDYHTRPLFLDAALLAEIGLQLREARRAPRAGGRSHKPAGPPAGD